MMDVVVYEVDGKTCVVVQGGIDTVAFAMHLEQLAEACAELGKNLSNAMQGLFGLSFPEMLTFDEYHDMPVSTREKHPIIRKIEMKSQVTARRVLRKARSRLRGV